MAMTDAGTETGDLKSKLIGIITTRDIQFHHDLSAPVTNVMSTDLVTAPAGTTLAEANEVLRTSRKGKLPIVDAQGSPILEHLEPNKNDRYRARPKGVEIFCHYRKDGQ